MPEECVACGQYCSPPDRGHVDPTGTYCCGCYRACDHGGPGTQLELP